MKTLALASLAFCVAASVAAQDKESYVLQYRDIAISEMHRTGIPASIKLSQAILESSYGRSELAREAHNHFGIKCGRSWGGDGYHLKDDDRDARGELVHSCFRVFRSAEESFIAHSDFLIDPAKAHRYGDLFTLAPDDYKGWAHGLQKGGYATNPSYARLLIRIIEEQDLYKYDSRKRDDALATQYTPGQDADSEGVFGQRSAYTIRFQNDIPYILADGGDNIKNISRRLDVPARKIVKYNEFIDSKKTGLDQGDRIYLQPLKRTYQGDQKTHIVDHGETIEEIAHSYGVKSKVLRKRNHLAEDCEPAPGSRLVLRGRQKQEIRCASPQSILAAAKPVDRSPARVPAPAESPVADARNLPSEPKIKKEDMRIASAPGLSEVFVQQALGAYTVQPKDTLYQIASAHGITVTELKKINHLSSDVIHPGQSLKVK